jgi:hypothetical protein
MDMKPHDARGFWRILLAVVAPLPMLAKGIYYLLIPVDGGAEFDTTLAAFRDHPGLASGLMYLDAVFVTLLLPATVAVVVVARRGAPRLTTWAAAITLTGFLTGFTLLGGVTTPALLTVRHGLDPSAMKQMSAALESEPLLGVASLLFIVGVVIGLGLLGAALWRSRAVPAVFGILLMLGGSTHPFIPGHVGQGIGLLVAAAGFAGAGLALLRTPNDAFDLPPLAAKGITASASSAGTSRDSRPLPR